MLGQHSLLPQQPDLPVLPVLADTARSRLVPAGRPALHPPRLLPASPSELLLLFGPFLLYVGLLRFEGQL